MNIIFYIFYFMQSIFQCFPVDHYWNRVNPAHHGSCHNPSFTADSTFAQSAVSIVTDFTFVILPVLIVRRLQMSRHKRMSLSFVLGLGAISSVAVVVRIPYVVNLASTDDFLWVTTDVAIWSCVEPGLGLTIINLVVTRPLLRSVFSSFGAMTSAARSRKQGYSSKTSAYRKPYTYGTGSTTVTANGTKSCNDPECGCDCHKPCTCGKQTTSPYLEGAIASDAEQGIAMSPVSPIAAHVKPDIRRTTSISVSSGPRSQTSILGSNATKSLPRPPNREGLENEDTDALVGARLNRDSYQGIGKAGLRSAP
jgi:hypothetical protein